MPHFHASMNQWVTHLKPCVLNSIRRKPLDDDERKKKGQVQFDLDKI